MTIQKKFLASVTAVALAAAVFASRADAGADEIIKWNQLAQGMIGGPPFSQTRQYAMVHVAMADAVVAIGRTHEPFRVAVWAPNGASPEAAAAQAAHDVLLFLVPAQAQTLADALSQSLAPIAAGRRASGVAVGKAVAAEVIAWRQQDGFANANPQNPNPFLPSTLPGIWQQTGPDPAQFALLGDVEPFGVLSASQFLPVPPPQLESEEYAEDYIEVFGKGRQTDSTRLLPDEERSAQLWAGVGAWANVTNPFRLWANVARDVAAADQLSLVETARLFALLTTSIHDSVQTAHASKFVYRLWRPVTAVAGADQDDNEATNPLPGGQVWVPLLGTPPYPSHASNMACIGAGAARMLANVFGTDAKAFTATWYSGAGTVVYSAPHTSFWDLAVDEGNSRIWGGIHFRFEIDASQSSCSEVADYIFANRLQPR